MMPTNVKAAAHNAEQRVRIAVELVRATEKKARAAKEKAWRAKLLFKLARRASKKAKKAAKRARTKAVQAQIALKELNEQIPSATRLSVRTRQGAPRPKRNAPNQSSTAAA
jgi:cell division protein FtsX